MTAKVLCFASAKGGTGKTVTAASLAKLLGTINKRVLLIDVDIDTNGLTLFYLNEIVKVRNSRARNQEPSIGIFEASSEVQLTRFKLDKNIDIIPASYYITKGSVEPVFEKVISKTIDSCLEEYDYIFLDAQAGTDTYAEVAINHSDEVVIVSEYDPVSMEGIERFKGIFFDILKQKRTWILLNKVLPEFAESIRDSLSLARYTSPIPWDKDVMLAFADRKLAIDTESFNQYTKAMIRTARSLLREEKKNIDDWVAKKKEELLRPVIVQFKEVEAAIGATEKTLAEQQLRLAGQKKQALRFLMNSLLLLVVLTAIMAQLFASGLINLTFYLSTIALFSSVLAYMYFSISRKSKNKEFLLFEELKAIADNLERLKLERDKLKVTAQFDFT